MWKRPLRLIPTAFSLMVLMAWPRTPEARTHRKRATTRIFKSRAAVRRALGRHVARQVPSRFDFTRQALVWIDLPTSAKPKLHIVRVPAKRVLRLHHSSALYIAVQRTPRALRFTLASDSPCSGGMRKPPRVMQACLRQARASRMQARKTLLLFATKRAGLRRASLARRRMPGRP